MLHAVLVLDCRGGESLSWTVCGDLFSPGFDLGRDFVCDALCLGPENVGGCHVCYVWGDSSEVFGAGVADEGVWLVYGVFADG